MDFPKYDGNIHPNEWIKNIRIKNENLNSAILLIDSTISLPNGIDNFEKLGNALKEDISFTVFKNTNKRILKFLKYIPEKERGKTSKFISDFRKLCYNAEINDIEEQKKYFYQTLPNNDHLSELFERREKISSMNDLIKEFEEIVTDESNEKSKLIKKGSIVTLKHVATGKYLTSSENLCYTTGSKTQVVFVGNSNPLWKISFSNELATYDDYINLQHIKSNMPLGVYYSSRSSGGFYDPIFYSYYKSPITGHTEVSCNNGLVWSSWKLKHSKLDNYKGYLKSNDIINLSINKTEKTGQYSNDDQVFLRSHDVQFTIGNDTFQEVVCHNERLGGNDEWCIELIKQG